MSKQKVKQWKIYSVQCPHCRKGNNFREIEYAIVDSQDTGAIVECDHCKRHMKVVRVEKTTLISVIPTTERGSFPGVQ